MVKLQEKWSFTSFVVGKEYTEGLKRIISWNVKFTRKIFGVLIPQCRVGEKIINQCIKTIEYSFEIMDTDSNEKYVESLNTCLNEVGVGYFLNKKTPLCLLSINGLKLQLAFSALNYITEEVNEKR